MEEQKDNLPSLSNNSDLTAFEGKLKEKLYELQIKRNTLSATRCKLHEGLLEKYNLERSLEDIKRDYEEIKIQLDVAVQAARRGESDRAKSREALARQSVQLEATIKDRNALQQQIRNMQVEYGNVKRELDEYEEKTKSHFHLQETCKMKETQWRSYLDTLQSEIKSLEEAQRRVKEMTCSALCVSKKLIFHVAHQKSVIAETLTEKYKLENQLISLSTELERLKRESCVNDDSKNKDSVSTQHLQQWKSRQQEMELRLKQSEKEIIQLEDSLSKTLASAAHLQKTLNAKDEKIKLLEEEAENLRNNKREDNVEKCSQKEEEKEINDDNEKNTTQSE